MVNASEGAARRLAVDTANLTYRVAMLESAADLIREAAAQVQSGAWLHGTTGERAQVVMSPEQADAVTTLIAVISEVL